MAPYTDTKAKISLLKEPQSHTQWSGAALAKSLLDFWHCFYNKKTKKLWWAFVMEHPWKRSKTSSVLVQTAQDVNVQKGMACRLWISWMPFGRLTCPAYFLNIIHGKKLKTFTFTLGHVYVTITSTRAGSELLSCVTSNVWAIFQLPLWPSNCRFRYFKKEGPRSGIAKLVVCKFDIFRYTLHKGK